MKFPRFVSAITKALRPAPSGQGGWLPYVTEARSGHWQSNILGIDRNQVLSHPTVYSCITLTASDVGKMRIKYVERSADKVWLEMSNPAYSPVLRKPNHFQNRIQFLEHWMLSKLLRGNTYVLKVRDQRNVVIQLYVLDPDKVRPLVSDAGDVYYEIHQDELNGVRQQITVPAKEIIHDRMNCLFHPLVGVSPIYAAGLAATQGLNIQNNSVTLFRNGASPGGILTAPGNITDSEANRLTALWNENYGGKNAGRVAFLGNNVTYKQMAMTAVDAQVIDQLKWSAETICSVFHVPPYKVGVGDMPKYDNIQSLNVEYYSQCLQIHIESIELCLDEGLEMAEGKGTELDIKALLRMDTQAQYKMLGDAVKGSILSPNEARFEVDKPPVDGGESPMAQQQDFTLAALAKRDAKDDPFSTGKPVAALAPPASAAAPKPAANNNAAAAKDALIQIQKGLSYVRKR